MSSSLRDVFQRRWYQFTLRTLFAIIAVVAGCLLAWQKCVEPYRAQREAVAIIEKLGGGYKMEEAAGWIPYLTRNGQDLTVVDLANADRPQAYLPYLARLSTLRTLVVGGQEFDDQALLTLAGFTALHGLVLDSTVVSDEAIEKLKQCQRDLVIYKSERRAIEGTVRMLRDSWIYDTASPEWLRTDVGDAYFWRPADL